MKRSPSWFVLAVVLVGASAAPAGEMKTTLKAHGENLRVLLTRFATYGYGAERTIFLDADTLRIKLPGKVEGIGQTGVYSVFALAGDCELAMTYDLLSLPPPVAGYGAGVGIAFDVNRGGGRADIQRVLRPSGECGYALHTDIGAKKKERDLFVPAEGKWGRLCMRRIGSEVIFLTGEESLEVKEIARLPFTDKTIRAVRLFADPGGSPTALDARLGQIEMRAEEITGGVARRDVREWPWWWRLTGLPVIAGLVYWVYRRRRAARDLDADNTSAKGR
jgi:hypothetical protein